jgi:glycosyltransferase involved in cell wall biosynthesis
MKPAIKVFMVEFQDVRYASRAYKEARSLAEAGYQVTFLSFNDSLTERKIHTDGLLTLFQLPHPFWARRSGLVDRIKRYLAGVALILRMNLITMQTRAHIYHVHDLKVLPGGVFARLLYGGYLVYDAHELHMAKHPDTVLKNRVLNRCNYYFERAALMCIDLLIHASVERADYVKRLYSIPMPLVIENHAVMCKPASSDEIRIQCDVTGTDILLVYIGAIVPGTFKKVEIVIEALPFLKDYIHFVLIGPCTDINRRNLLKMADRLQISRRVHLLKAVPSAQLVPFISAADLSVIPMQATCLNEEFSALNKFSEACMAGLPIIASDYPNLHELIYKNPVGPVGETFDINNINSFIQAMDRCLGSTKRKMYRRNALLLARDHLNWSIEEKKLLNAYKNLKRD